MAYLFISHDLSVVEHISDVVGVMYLGSLVEFAPKRELFKNPLHPYTQALFSAIPVPDPTVQMKRVILEGSIPSPANPPAGCKFHTRCNRAMEICKAVQPEERDFAGHRVACHLAGSLPPAAPHPERLAGGDRLRRLQSFFRAPAPQQGAQP